MSAIKRIVLQAVADVGFDDNVT